MGEALSSSLDGWYWGNMLAGGVLGMIIIDPMTEAMWKLNPTIFVELESTQSGLAVSVMDVNNVPNSWKSARVHIGCLFQSYRYIGSLEPGHGCIRN